MKGAPSEHLRVLLVHNYLRPPSGENTVFEQEKQLLESKGHEVITYTRHNEELGEIGRTAKALVALRAIWSSGVYRDIAAIIRKERPDIAHFHNIFPIISPAAYCACKAEGVPVVQTLHNFRIVCPGALLFRNNKICEECAGGRLLPGIRHACYHDSPLQTAGIAGIVSFHKLIGTWRSAVDLYIVLSEFALAKYRELGFPSESYFVKPNFLQNPVEPSYVDGGYGVYIGRIGEEKGMRCLLEAMRSCPEMSFKIIGDGPISEGFKRKLHEYGLRNVEYLGSLEHEVCMKYLRDARFLVLPSECYEGSPMVLLEAMSAGKPAVVSNVGILSSMVTDGVNGFLSPPGHAEALAQKMRWMYERPDDARLMGKNGRAIFDEKYTSERNYHMLLQAYQKAVEVRRGRQNRNGEREDPDRHRWFSWDSR
jgi:glycosyltransferase involved in cell wall biosynthesis